MSIVILPENIIHQIRAGEVIERPASAIKELIDNSIDANSNTIRVSFLEGGKSFFSVEDDGCGISEDDLPLAMTNHATSKFIDLNDIRTMGFRGEALASLSLVAETKIISRLPGQDAWEIDNKKNEIYPSSGVQGTWIASKDLFKNFPARKNFLKSDRYEGGLIKKCIMDFALYYFNKSFYLSSGRNSILAYPAQTTQEERIEQIFGKDFLKNSLHIKGDFKGIDYNIYLGEPTWDKHDSIGQHIYVNGRYVKITGFRNMAKASFSGLSKSTPSFICYLNVPFQDVNCNVHPNKKEVRLKYEEDFLEELYKIFMEKLGNKKISSVSISDMAKKLAKPMDISKESIQNNTSELPLGKPVAIIGKNYIICEKGNGMIMIDLHAAHERVVLQKIINNLKNMNGKKITPIHINLTQEEKEILNDNNVFDNFKFKYSVFDKGIAVTEIPEYLDENKIEIWLKQACSITKSNPYLDVEKELMEELSSLMACHNAFRTGDDISLIDANNLLREIENTSFTAQCNHGRPTTIMFSFNDIGKMFAR